mmetsp:Transcript_36055/g.42149  ORF Transcript_36055/g.42149 Transcript_36055/m.42149 type:complete len:459 (+) Transcript_36055:2-1378(+)
MSSITAAPKQYFKPTLTPMSADLEKLGLKPGHNIVRYITHSSLKGRVVVDSNIFFWPSDTKIVVSDIDGTVTKSDVWGHILPMIGRDWTHAGICSLYSKVAKNGYEFVYLTARSMAQQEQTRNFLWSIEQDGATLPRGPVLTAPDRFFTALTQEVSKKAHEFKISCLKSIHSAFPKHSKPFYAGFGNRIGDVVSYTATQIPKHKIFIIDTNSTLHVCRVKQTYKNLAHLVDVTFPPLKPSPFFASPVATESTVMRTSGLTSDDKEMRSSVTSPPLSGGGAGGTSPQLKPAASSGVPSIPQSLHHNGGLHEGESVDSDFNSFNFWRIPPEEFLAPLPTPLNTSSVNSSAAAPPVSIQSSQATGTRDAVSKKTSQGGNVTISIAPVNHPSFIQTPVPMAATPASPAANTATPSVKSSWLPRWLGGSGGGNGTSAGDAAPIPAPSPQGPVSSNALPNTSSP